MVAEEMLFCLHPETPFPPTSSDVNASSKTRRPPAKGKRCHHQTLSACQVTGCGGEVVESQARRLKTCEPHRRALTIDMGGVPSRFCQQCTLIHPLNYFDGAKRGCRRRLELRNSRRKQKTAARRRTQSSSVESSETPASSTSSGDSKPMKTESSTLTKSSASTDSPPESPRSPSSLHRPANSETSVPSFPLHQNSAGIDATIPYSRDERPLSWDWEGYFPSGPSDAAAIVTTQTPRYASITPEDFENALISGMQWSESREEEKIGRSMHGSISGEFAALSPADLPIFLKLPISLLPDDDAPFVEDGNDSADDVLAWP